MLHAHWKGFLARYVTTGLLGGMAAAALAYGLRPGGPLWTVRDRLRQESDADEKPTSCRRIAPVAKPVAMDASRDGIESSDPLDLETQDIRVQATTEEPPPISAEARRYAEARKAYAVYWKTVRTLQAQRDAATGGERMRLIDELRSMRGDAVRISEEYSQARLAYEGAKARDGQRKMEIGFRHD